MTAIMLTEEQLASRSLGLYTFCKMNNSLNC